MFKTIFSGHNKIRGGEIIRGIYLECLPWLRIWKRARVNNLNQWSGWWYKYTKQASSRSTI